MCICIHTAARAAFRIPFKGANGFSGVPGGGREGGQTHMSKLHYNKTQWGRGGAIVGVSFSCLQRCRYVVRQPHDYYAELHNCGE